MDFCRARLVHFGALNSLSDTGKKPGGGLGVCECEDIQAGPVRFVGACIGDQ